MYRKQILVVEDNEIDRDMLRKILEEKYELLEAVNGQEALDVLKQNRDSIALILLDIIMPVMDGYTFLDIMKKEKGLSGIPVIVMTQEEGEDSELTALEHGANDYIPKPYRTRVIQNRVASLIKLRETAAMMSQFKYDNLTGLYTKEYFYRKVRETLDQNPEKEYTILCSNIVNFKLYNDTYGREAGDRLIIEEANILRKRVSEGSICCRYTADRLLCLTEKESERKGRECFVKARANSRSELSGNVSVKLGIYEISNRTIPVEQMCDRAFWVVDTIKGIYDQHIAVYDDALRNQLLREQAITDTMEEALHQKQFIVYFQPKYNLHDGRLIGAEALVRWVHPKWGFMSPGEFIPLFEKNGFIRQLDSYVWEKTCEKLQEWSNKGYEIVPVSVNVSRADVYHIELVEYLLSLVDKYQIDPSYLHLEITESAYTENPDQIINIVEELRRHRFVIEMDDFGSGYSSLNMLGRMSIDILKLDMGFVRSEFEKPLEQSILNDVINMAHRLHLNVVAEGVETKDQKNWLTELGCDYAQGYFYAKPIPDAEFEVLLRQCKQNKESHSLEESSRIKDVSGAKRTVLIVEDNEINREMLREVLTEYYIVLTAENGEEGLSILRRNGCYISVILLDIQMPVMDGYEFLKQIKQDEMYCKIPVIVTTALNSAEEEEKCLSLGAAEFIEKPYSAKRILRRIGNIVHLREYNSIITDIRIDLLTGFRNRKAYYEDIAMIEQSPEKNSRPVGVIFADINGLKMINDKAGHEAGDRLIAEVARKIREIFPDAYIYRLGGDEFVIFSFAENEVLFKENLQKLKTAFKGDASAAVGSVWLQQASGLEKQVARADQAMYRDKSRYYEEKNHLARKAEDFVPEDMLRNIDEISEYLPGGFFIYRANEKREIITFNSELLKVFGCETKEEFRTFTGNSFRGMVHPEDLELVERSIGEQIEKDKDIDYVQYRIRCKDGTEKRVRDYGRFVHTDLYGDVYYVFINTVT